MLSTPSLLFTSANLPEGSKAVAFTRALENVIALEFTLTDERGLDVNWSAAKLDNLIVSRTRLQYTAAVCSAKRTSRQIAREDDCYADLLEVRHGALEVRRSGPAVLVRERQFVLTASDEPKEFVASNDSEIIGARIPWWLLASRLNQTGPYLHRPFSVDSGLCGVAADFLHSLARRAPEIPSLGGATLATQFADLLALAVSTDAKSSPFTESSVRHALFERVCRYADQHLTDPELTPHAIATANGISERYLFKLFQQAGFTVGEYVRRRRLAACRRALEDPRQLRRSIAEIAYANGLSSPSRLTKAFRQEFGMTPRAARERTKEKIRHAAR